MVLLYAVINHYSHVELGSIYSVYSSVGESFQQRFKALLVG